ncbi:hypothetical protein [Modestobacter versicolor]|uniref:hypothetical protein n=1 Tax=Modestobacter versicolor TaxID=429133 RepID=UPI0034E04945
MKPARTSLLASTLTVGAIALGGLASPALADTARTTTVCAPAAGTCDHTTIQAALDAAVDGDTVRVVGDVSVAGTTTIAKDVTVTGAPGATVTQTASAVTFSITGAGATLSGLTITSDTAKAAEFVYLAADGVTLSGTTISGPEQAGAMSTWVTNRGFVTAGGISGLTVSGNTVHSVRSGAYLNPNGRGVITGNTLYDTKGDFLVDNAAFAFTGNRAGDPDQRSEWGFVVFAGTDAGRYPSMAALSAANNGMTAWDQRSGDRFVPPLVADDCKDGGWKTLDPGFRNQGQCVKSVAGK